MNHKKAQTGRTTRMLERALELSKKGRAVTVIVAELSGVIPIRRRLDEMSNGRLHGIRVQARADKIDWRKMRIWGDDSESVVLVDHFVIESEFAMMLEMLTRFDEPE